MFHKEGPPVGHVIGFVRVESPPLAPLSLAPLWAPANARVAKTNLIEAILSNVFSTHPVFINTPTVSQLFDASRSAPVTE
jgi:hypothetical protein